MLDGIITVHLNYKIIHIAIAICTGADPGEIWGAKDPPQESY